MRLPCVLAGLRMDWRFRDSYAFRQRLEEWCQTIPSRLAIFRVRLSSMDWYEPFADALEASARGFVGGRVALHIFRPEEHEEINASQVIQDQLPWTRRLFSAIGWPESNRSSIQQIAVEAMRWYDQQAGAGIVLVPLYGANTGKRESWLREMLDFMSTQKNGANGLLWVVVGDSTTDFRPGTADDFSEGRPENNDFYRIDGTDGGSRWKRYLHIRLAWEYAGCLDRFSPDQVESLAPEDNALEEWLNENAERLSRDAGNDALTAWSPTMPANANAVRELKNKRLLWSPLGADLLMPVPWVARQWLRQGGRGEQWRPLLRYAMNCQPLVEWLLVRCLSLEPHFACRVWSEGPDASTPDAGSNQPSQAEKNYSMSLYPDMCPARPNNPADFLSLGNRLALAGRHPLKNSGHQLRMLRNHLAHGHYAGYQCLEELMRLSREIR